MFKELLKNKCAEQELILNTAMTEKRAMTDDEQTKYDALEKEIKNLEKTIEAQAKVDARTKEDNTPVNEPLYAEPRNADSKKWKNFGEFISAVKNAGMPEGRIDNRLITTVKNASGLNEQINSDGGFLVEKDFVSELLTRTYDASQIAGRVRKLPIGANSNGIKIPGIDETSRANGSRYGGIQAYWSGEAQTVTATKPKFRKIEMDLEKLFALCYLTNELMMDSTALEAFVQQAFIDEMSFKLDDAIINGTGAGLPLGIMNAPCLVSVSKEAGQAATTILHENISKMWGRLYSRSRANAVWLINQDTEQQLENMVQTIGTAGSVSPFAREFTERGTIKGRPVIAIEQCQTLGTTGDIILADLTQWLMIEKGGIDAQSSIHVRFLYDEQVLRFTMRCNGMPTWNAPLTPFKGSNTLSPFVTLATRS